MGVFNFDKAELEGIASREAQVQYLQKFGFVPPPLPTGYTHVVAPSQTAIHSPAPQHSHNNAQVNGHGVCRRTTPPPTPPPANGQVNGFGHSGHGGEHVTTLVARKAPKNKKRVQPTFTGSLGAGPSGTSSYGVQNSVPSASVPIASHLDNNVLSNVNIKLPRPPLQSFSHSQARVSSSSAYAHPAEPDPWMDVDSGFVPDDGMDMDVPISTLDSRGKRRVSELDDSGRSVKARTLGGDRVREAASSTDIREIRSQSGAVRHGDASVSSVVLEAPALKTYLCCNADDSNSPPPSQGGDVLEVRNPEDGGGSWAIDQW